MEIGSTRFKNCTALVTGGAGFIGGNLVKRLLELGCDVIILDDLSAGKKGNLPDPSLVCRFVEGSILDDELMDDVFRAPINYIFHLAASFANRRSVKHPIEDMEINVGGTLKLLERSRSLRGLERFIYVSSSCVFGSCDGELTEDSPRNPETPYGVSKLAAEHYTIMYSAIYGLPVTAVRYFNVYGPGERASLNRGVVINFIQEALEGSPLVITGDGNETREFVFVDDAVESTIRAAIWDESNSQIFNVGSGKQTRLEDLALMINRLAHNNAGIVYRDARSWDRIKRRSTSVIKCKAILEYVPDTGLEEGLSATIDWCRTKGRGG